MADRVIEELDEAVPCRLTEFPVAERALVVRRYLQKVPGARTHIPVDRHAPMADLEAVAPRCPVVRVRPAPVVLVETILPG
jgi:hypothetical protein